MVSFEDAKRGCESFGPDVHLAYELQEREVRTAVLDHLLRMDITACAISGKGLQLTM